MTKDEAIKLWRAFGSTRIERNLREKLPQHVVDRAIDEDAEDIVEGLIAIGILVVDQPCPQGTITPEADHG